MARIVKHVLTFGNGWCRLEAKGLDREMVEWVLNFALLLTLGAWAGSIIFFSFMVTRSARQLEERQTSKFLRSIFPQYYSFQIACGAVAFVAALGLLAQQGFRSKLWGMITAAALAVLTGVLFWIRQAVLPRMTSMRDRMAIFREQKQEPDKVLLKEWGGLHRLTVIVNLLALVAALLLFSGAICTVQWMPEKNPPPNKTQP
jgi:hypothetical protein